ncbi:hypothetical protein GFV12_07355 [Desulfurobacterium thermolithotrophum]|uniref:hypothetical protein n=1 Tax=Desulfurobacterium thermolithotrophum TaxID=64160 RepID=UPI0013D7886E|nr:hypothetical protein [Desulfurobacterium thermolithotrophum]
MTIKYFILSLFSIFIICGCNSNDDITLITNDKYLLIPLKATNFCGYFQKNKIEIQMDSVGSEKILVRFINFSKYNSIITDEKTTNYILSNSKSWIKLCMVAVEKVSNTPKIKTKFYLLVKKTLLNNRKKIVTLIKGWNQGVYLLKDPFFQDFLLKEERLKYSRNKKFILCTER